MNDYYDPALKQKNLQIIQSVARQFDYDNFMFMQQDIRNTKCITEWKPDIVIHAAGKVGGILHNKTYPAEFIFQNSQMALNIINSSHIYKVKKLINLGSACIYPKFAKQPIKETYLLGGKLESSNEAYEIGRAHV